MLSCFRKLGLLLSSVAFLVSVAAFSFHFHHETSAKAQSHCSVCSVSGQAKLLTPSSASQSPVIFEVTHRFFLIPSVFVSAEIFQNTSSRAPPAV